MNVARNKKAKVRVAYFGDDMNAPSQAGGGTFTNQDNQPSLSNTGLGAYSSGQSAASLPTSAGANVNQPGTIPDMGSATPIGGAIDLAQSVVTAGMQAISAAGQSAPAYQQGASLAAQGVSGPGLAAGLSSVAATAQTAFNAGVAVANGAAQTQAPPGMSPAAQVGYLTAKGLKGAPAEVKTAVAQAITQDPAVKAGFIAGATHNINSWWHRLLHFFHLA